MKILDNLGFSEIMAFLYGNYQKNHNNHKTSTDELISMKRKLENFQIIWKIE